MDCCKKIKWINFYSNRIKRLNMKSFNQFLTICEAIYDRDKKSDVDLEVGKIGKEIKKTAP